MQNTGHNTVRFVRNNQEISFNYPNTKVTGIMWGKKEVSIEGTMTFRDEGNRLKAVLFFQKQTFSGLLYHADPSKAPGLP